MWSVLITLSGLALVLSGCGGGGGGGKKPNKKPAELTSQTVHGALTGKIDASIMSEDIKSTMIMYMDADTLDMRVDTMDTLKGLNMTAAANASILYQPAKKQVTYFLEEKAVPDKTPCMYYPMEGLPPVDMLKTLLKEYLKNHTPSGMDGNYRHWNFQYPKASNMTGHVEFDLDDGNGLRKASTTLKMTLNKTISLSMEADFKASDVKLGKPNASIFTVPAAWGKCVPGPKAISLLENPLLLRSPLGPLLPLLAATHDSTPAENENLLVV